MMSREQLKNISKGTSLHLYQQEKDYLIKLFLFNYFRRYDNAVFKGGTCLRYLFGTDRFSEDIDLNLRTSPNTFRKEVQKVLDEFERLGIESGFINEEVFEDAYTSEIWFYGPLYDGSNQTQNKFRLDAGRRGGILKEPRWRLIASEYPETKDKFLVQVMDEDELFVEKIITMLTRSKGRDLYDVWYFLMNEMVPDPDLFERKLTTLKEEGVLKEEFKWDSYPSEKEYQRDLKRLVSVLVPYSQVIEEVKDEVEDLRKEIS